ncbi:MAG TPA: MFS transporter [Noviherbaspirillum sp.]|nr:MFS transporter [Noviherbaspirillum sp.]
MNQARASWADILGFYKQFMPLFGGLFFCHLGIGASLSTLPFYVQQTLGQNDVAVGVVIAAIALAAVVTRPVAGRLADRYGYKRLMLCGAALCVLAGAGYFAPLPLEGLVAVRLLHGIGEGTVFTAGATWLITLAPEARRGKIVGLYGISMWTGITLGALIGAAIMNLGGFSAVWAFILVVPAIGFLLVAVKEKAAQSGQARKPSLFPPTVLIPGVALALAAAGYAALSAFAALYLSHQGIMNGIAAFNAFGFTYVGVRLFLGHWPDKLGPARVAFWSALVEACGLLLVALAPNLMIAIAGGLVMGAGLSLLYPSLALIVINHTEKTQHGAALGTFTSFWDLGLAVGGPVGGWIAGAASYPAIFFAMMGCAMLSALLAAAQSAQKKMAMHAQSGMSVQNMSDRA